MAHDNCFFESSLASLNGLFTSSRIENDFSGRRELSLITREYIYMLIYT